MEYQPELGQICFGQQWQQQEFPKNVKNDGLERPSKTCIICGKRAFARDQQMFKICGKSHFDCESGGHSFYPKRSDPFHGR